MRAQGSFGGRVPKEEKDLEVWVEFSGAEGRGQKESRGGSGAPRKLPGGWRGPYPAPSLRAQGPHQTGPRTCIRALFAPNFSAF